MKILGMMSVAVGDPVVIRFEDHKNQTGVVQGLDEVAKYIQVRFDDNYVCTFEKDYVIHLSAKNEA